MKQQIIKTENLTYETNNKKILDQINIEINKNEFTTIIGPNGAGKTTLIELITKIINPTQGSIYLYNKDIKTIKPKELSKHISYVPQIIDFDYDFDVEQIVLMGRIPYQTLLQTNSIEDKKITEEAMKKTGIYELKNRNINTLSGGEKQRVAIARALVQQTQIIILDEPISNLDISQQIAIMKLLQKLKQEGKAIICILHDINTSLKYSDKTILLKQGKIIATGETKKIITEKNINTVFGVNAKIIEQGDGVFVQFY